MPKIRILIVDDSVVIRRLLTDALSGDPEIEIVGTAANGKIALQKISQVNPDLITLDVEMPEMDGIETLTQLRKSYPRLPVIMFSTLTEAGADVTLKALALGASDYVAKPANVGSVTVGIQRVQDELIPKIKVLCSRCLKGDHVPASLLPSSTFQPSPAFKIQSPTATVRPDILAIGTSTGGPNALAEVIPNFTKDFPVPIVIVQHMPPVFTKFLADRLGSKTTLKVSEAVQGQVLEPGHALIAPGNFHMALKQEGAQVKAVLNQDPPENSCRPAVDVLFRSVAEIYGSRILAVILTGMGQDGLRGCEVIREKGGRVLAQDEESSVVWGMPGFVAKAGLAEKVLPLNKVSAEILRIFNAPKATPLSAKNLQEK